MRILIADDSKAVHAFMKSLFGGTSHQLVHAYDGLQAFDLWQKEPQGFDIILLDWEMPVLDGYGSLDKILSAGCQTPIMMVTSKNDPSYISKAIERGAMEYVMKPFDRDILFEKMEMVLGRKVA
jgi:two-component system chemotaxis response regulator CheY